MSTGREPRPQVSSGDSQCSATVPIRKLNFEKHFQKRPASDWNDGGADRDRTGGLLVANEALSQLSYSPTEVGVRVGFHFSSLVRHRPSWRVPHPQRWNTNRSDPVATNSVHWPSIMSRWIFRVQFERLHRPIFRRAGDGSAYTDSSCSLRMGTVPRKKRWLW